MHRSKQLFIALTLGLGLTLALLTLLALPTRAASFTVTKFTDTNDGTCDADCSLREAIIAANASGVDDTITLGAGTYTLSIAGTGEDSAATGDLDAFVGNDGSQGNTVWLNQDAQQGGVTNNSGGTLVFGGELTLTVNIPAGSLPAQGASFTYTPLLGPTPDFSNTLQYYNRAFELDADTDVEFDPPITLTVYYPPETEITTDTLRLYYRDTDENPVVWKDVASTCTPTSTYRYAADFVEVAICHLTEFALFDLLSSGGSDVFLPLILKNE